MPLLSVWVGLLFRKKKEKKKSLPVPLLHACKSVCVLERLPSAPPRTVSRQHLKLMSSGITTREDLITEEHVRSWMRALLSHGLR